MFTVEVKKLMKVMIWVRRVSFIICLFALLFFVYIGYKGVEYKVTGLGMAAITLVPLLILFTLGRWWESLAGKEFIGLSFIKERGYEDAKKSGHIIVEKDAYTSEIIHI